MNRLRFETRSSRCRLHQFRRVRQVEVDELSAIVADRVIVTFRFTIVPARTVSKIDFENEACLFQVAQRVVDSCVADTGQTQARRLKNIAGRRVVIPLLNDLKDGISLGSQLRFFPGYLQSGFRIILKLEFVKRWPDTGFHRFWWSLVLVSSLRNLRGLCVSAVGCSSPKRNHRDTENAEVAQRKPNQGTTQMLRSAEAVDGFVHSRRSCRRNYQTAGSEFHVGRVNVARGSYRRVASQRNKEQHYEAGR